MQSQFPNEGRRKLRLKVIEKFWKHIESIQGDGQSVNDNHEPDIGPGQLNDPDPFDYITDGPELGILLRVDYSNEDAWGMFQSRLQEAEKELARAIAEGDEAEDKAPGDDASLATEDAEMDEGSGDDEGDGPFPILKIVNPTDAHERETLTNISNLAALRLLNEVNIRRSPLPDGNRRIATPNRLIDLGGRQEIYTGKSIWIYDEKSNNDQSLRLVSPHGSIYGTATGDSWRARVSHVYELQLNISGGMQIGFGGLDGWDLSERRRNLDEANRPIV